jgi:hypothetical protein
MQKDDFIWYLKNQDSLVEKYRGEYLVISCEKVVYHSVNREEVCNKAVEMPGLGNFILQLCTPGTEAYTMTFHTQRVRFNPVA